MKARNFSQLLTRMQGGIDRISGVIETSRVEEVLGKGFTYATGDGFRMSFRRLQDGHSKGYFTFQRANQ
jgi:hypothetical protein